MAGCSSPREEASTPPKSSPALLAVVLPDLSRAERGLRERVQTAYSSLLAGRDNASTSEAELGVSYGELGKLLMAAEYLDDAEPFLLNAQTLTPNDMRWPYYLGHLHRLGNEPAKAVPFFEQAIRLKPEDPPTLTWLGQLYVDEGRLDESVAILKKALEVQPKSAAALFGLGRAALARQHYGEAVSHLEAAIVADPQALAVHYPLAMAYRGLGNQRQAEAHLRQWKNVELRTVDPLMDQIGSLLQTSLDYALRGTNALDRKNWTEATSYFRKALELAPNDATLHLNLGNALYLGGDEQGGQGQFEEAIRLAPGYARAHFALGVTMETRGRDGEAIEQFSAALKFDPGLVDARFSLADALRRAGQAEASLPHYKAIVSGDPSASQARFGYAIALVRLRRYEEARAALEEAITAHPDQVGFAHALARLLASAPDDRTRDGRRALAIVQEIRKSYRSSQVTETLAMAQAELGQFEQAAASQRSAIAEATREGRGTLAPQLADNLALYQKRAPCRSPWRDDDPIHRPRSASGLGR